MALEVLRKVRTGLTFEVALEDCADALDGRDHRLAYEISAGVLRWRRPLDRIIRTCLREPERPLPDDIADILRIGVYQLRYLDRVPAYAAVSACVDLARKHETKYARMVNAVLRTADRKSNQSDSSSFTLSLAEQSSHPDWLVERWLNRFGETNTRRLLEHNNHPPPLVLQPTTWSIERLEAELGESGIDREIRLDGCGINVRHCTVPALPGYEEGTFVVQDPTQRRLIDFAAVRAGEHVWDACAAPGGKSAALSVTATVFASDISGHRLARLRQNLTRTAPTAKVFQADARRPGIRTGSVETVLIDAPCSATGSMAGHPDARWRLVPESIATAARIQAELLEGASQVVPPGGLMVYLTCSLEDEENGEQIERFLRRNPDFERDGPDLAIFPWEALADGGFGSRLRRKG